jgi:hypothetical protein
VREDLHYYAGFDAVRINRITVDLDRISPTLLRFRYTVHGDVDALVLPPATPPFRARDLWKTTCFEAFLKPAGHAAYRELNFSPSGQWSAYDFAAYRTGMVEASLPTAPDISMTRDADQLELSVAISLDLPDDPYRLALAAVIEEEGGHISYWALCHPSEQPDFHHDSGFDSQLPPAPQSSPRT